MRPDINEFVQVAREQVGLAYIGCAMPLWTPRGGNCDGLVEYAARRAGIVLPFGSTDLRAYMGGGHHVLTFIEASETPGALIFDEDPRWRRHVAISTGRREAVEAVPDEGVRVVALQPGSNRHWTIGIRIG